MPRATTVYEAAAVCDPDLALEAGHEWYVDLSPYRGTNVVQQIYRAIAAKEEPVSKGLIPRDQGFAKLLLTGLRGSGKTTELNQLNGLLTGKRYFPVLISGVRELNLEQLTHAELLMSLLWSLQEAQPAGGFRVRVPARADEELNLALASILVESRERQTAELKLQAELGIGAEVPFFLKVKTALNSMQGASTERSRTVRAQLFQRASGYIANLNHILDEVHQDLRGQGCKGLVFLIDELDRLPPREAEDFPGHTVPELVFDLQSAHLKAPRAHIVYTFPSQLLARVNLGRSWPERPVIVPAVKVQDRGSGKEHPSGCDALARLVEARVDVARVFNPSGGVRELVRFSGGYARDLLRLVRYASNRTDTTIGPAEIAGATRDLIADYDYLVAPQLVERLTEVDREKRLPRDSAYAELLERNLILTYWNDEEWADLHPAVKQTPGYRATGRHM